MSVCSRKYKQMLHAYEVGFLNDSEREEFEQHVLECTECFQQLNLFQKEADLLRNDDEIQDYIIDLHKSSTKLKKSSETKIVLRWALGIAAIITIMILSPWKLEFKSTNEIIAEDKKLLVLDFENHSQTSDKLQYGTIVSNLLITNLATTQQIQIISHQRVSDVIQQLGFDQTKPLEDDQKMAIAKFLNAHWLLTGSILQTEPLIEVTSQLIELPTGHITSAQRITSEADDNIFDLTDKLTKLAIKDLSLSGNKSLEYKFRVSDITTSSENAYNSYLQGVENYNRFYYREALTNFENAITFDSTFAMAYYYLSKLKDRALIEKGLAYADKVNPKEKLYIESRAAFINGEIDSSMNLLNMIIDNYPEEKDAYYQIGYINYYNHFSFDSAIVYLTQVIDIDPYFKPAYNLLIYCYTMKNNYEQAIISMDKYLSLDSLSANPYDTKGDLNAIFGKLNNAIESYKKALSIKPDFYSSLYQLGYMYLYQGNFDKADSCLQALLKSNSKNMSSAARMYLTYLPIKRGQYKNAMKQLDNHISDEKKDTTLSRGSEYKYFLRAILYEGLGDINKALATLDTVLVLSSKSPYTEKIDFVHYKIHLLALDGEIDIIESFVDSMSNIDKYTSKEFFTYWYAQGMIAFTNKEYKKASDYFLKSVSQVIEKNEYGYYVGRYMAALSFYYGGYLAEALDIFENMKTVYTSRRLFWSVWDNKMSYYLGRIYEDSKWNNKAVESYDEFIKSMQNADFELIEIQDAKKRLLKLSVELE